MLTSRNLYALIYSAQSWLDHVKLSEVKALNLS